MDVIAVAGRKGGIGKSTIVGNLAAEFAAKRRRVLVLDADPQHSMAAWAKQGDGLLKDSVRTISDGAPEELIAQTRESQKDFDIVLIDTPPGMQETIRAAAMVSDLLLLPCGPSPLDLFALKDAIKLGLKVRAARRAKKPRIRLVPSRIMMNTVLGRNLSTQLEEMGSKVLPPICQRVVLAEAVNHGLTIAEYAPSSAAHEEFVALAKAVEKVLRKG
jgi:chromosome partitioning protein